MPNCQSNHAFETSQRHSATGCRLIVDGYASSLMKTPALGLHSQTNCVTTLLPVDFKGLELAKILAPKSLWNLCWRMLAHYPQVRKQPCSELRKTSPKKQPVSIVTLFVCIQKLSRLIMYVLWEKTCL